MTKFGKKTQAKESHVSRGSAVPPPKGRGPASPNFSEPYLCPNSLT